MRLQMIQSVNSKRLNFNRTAMILISMITLS